MEERRIEAAVLMPPESVELIARRAAEILRESEALERPPSPYMSIAEAAEHLRCEKKRIYDLRSSGRLRRIAEGGRALVLREEVERLVVDEDALPVSSSRRRVA